MTIDQANDRVVQRSTQAAFGVLAGGLLRKPTDRTSKGRDVCSANSVPGDAGVGRLLEPSLGCERRWRFYNQKGED